LALFFAIDGPLLRWLTFSLAILLGLLALYPRIFQTSATGRYQKYFREQLGGDGPFTCEIEISAAGPLLASNSNPT
jgi:hypothetical protein